MPSCHWHCIWHMSATRASAPSGSPTLRCCLNTLDVLGCCSHRNCHKLCYTLKNSLVSQLCFTTDCLSVWPDSLSEQQGKYVWVIWPCDCSTSKSYQSWAIEAQISMHATDVKITTKLAGHTAASLFSLSKAEAAEEAVALLRTPDCLLMCINDVKMSGLGRKSNFAQLVTWSCAQQIVSPPCTCQHS